MSSETVYVLADAHLGADPERAAALHEFLATVPAPGDHVLLNGDRITQTHNNNYSNYDSKSVNQTIDDLKKQPSLTEAPGIGAGAGKVTLAQSPVRGIS